MDRHLSTYDQRQMDTDTTTGGKKESSGHWQDVAYINN